MANGVIQSIGTTNVLQNPVLLDTYINTFYVCPSDGYVIASCASAPSAKAIFRLFSADTDTYYVQVGGWGNNTYATWVAFARKGMRVKAVTVENSGHIQFQPFSN